MEQIQSPVELVIRDEAKASRVARNPRAPLGTLPAANPGMNSNNRSKSGEGKPAGGNSGTVSHKVRNTNRRGSGQFGGPGVHRSKASETLSQGASEALVNQAKKQGGGGQ